MSELLHHEEEPIVALASGQGSSAIAILRVSGKGCHQLLLPYLRKKAKSKTWEMNRQSLCDLIHPQDQSVLDEVMAVIFQAPHSYTGQDSLEIYVHGSPYIIQTALAVFYSLGIRHAEPGEFTRRAFLSGKIDLTAAEGIHGLISSHSHQQWLAARQLYTGSLKELVDRLAKEIVEAIAWLEARIDFPEEDDTSAIDRTDVRVRVEQVSRSLHSLLNSYASGKVASQGLSVAFFGEPNVGKSTLMNTLLNSERALVTDIPGTTRDYLEEPCLIHGRLVRLIDTAGVRKGAGTVESLGIQKTFEIARQADLVIFLCEDLKQASKIQDWIQEIQPKQFMKVLTKADLGQDPVGEDSWTRISCHTGLGMDLLKKKIQDLTDQSLETLSEAPVISSTRHKNAVEKALRSLDDFFAAYDSAAYDEILAFELHQACKHLHSLIGFVHTDDILDVVFSSFCVGK